MNCYNICIYKYVSAVLFSFYQKYVFANCRSHCSKPYPDQDCWSATKKAAQDPPLLFNLDEDPSEVYTLTPKDPEYNDIMDTMKNVCSMLFSHGIFTSV